MPRRLTAHLLLAVLVIVPMAAATAQEVQSDERPDTGYRLLGPRTVISFVRQTLPDRGDGTSDFPRWNTVVHVSNVGNGPLVAAAIFVASNGGHRSARRFPVPPGHTVSVTVAEILSQIPAADLAPPLTDAVTGIVLLRFFAPLEVPADRFFAQMVTAEQFLDLGPGVSPVIIPLDVRLPQSQVPVHRRPSGRR